MATDMLEWARTLLLGPTLQDKLTPPPLEGTWSAWDASFTMPQRPGRVARLEFSDQQLKFPGRPHLGEPEARCKALHSFANHELLAIEMMAAALLRYPHGGDAETLRCKRGIAAAIVDEQKHLGLYLTRMGEGGHELGDFPLNDFFWRQASKLETPASFFALMALTFESANLDFALYYEEAFRAAGDSTTADILRVVYEDELTHVGLGAHWLGRWRGDRTLWEYYLSVLPAPITPARAKGLHYRPESRLRAGVPGEWVDALTAFEDPFRVTRRKHAPPVG